MAVFTTATDDWRKNLTTLRAAWPLLDSELRLVTPADLGYVRDERLPELYRGAAAFVYPSRFEGFGLPIVEAMAAGCPVIAAAGTALPEVVGDAGLLVDADDVGGWTDAMARTLNDDGLRSRLSRAGRERVRSMTPKASAQRLFAAYRVAGA